MSKAAFAAVTLLVVCVATLTPARGTTAFNFGCIACGEVGATDVTANVALFVPVGFAFVLLTGRARLAFAGCVALTCLIEAAQVSVVAGRDASASDLLANSLGGWLGVVAAVHRETLMRPAGIAARRLAVVAAAGFAAALTLTAAALVPAPVPAALWVQWTPVRRGYDRFSGDLLALHVNGFEIGRGHPVAPAGLHEVLRKSSWRVIALVRTGRLERGRSVIARIAGASTPLVSIEQVDADLTCRQKTRAGVFRFRSPTAALRNVVRERELPGGQSLRLICGREMAALVVGVSRGDHTRERRLALSPSLGWFVLSPFDVALTERHAVLGAVWLATLAFPAGYWTAAARRAREMGRRSRHWGGYLLVAAALSIGLVFAPLMARTAAAAWWEWAASIAGVVLGELAHARLAPLGSGAPATT